MFLPLLSKDCNLFFFNAKICSFVIFFSTFLFLKNLSIAYGRRQHMTLTLIMAPTQDLLLITKATTLIILSGSCNPHQYSRPCRTDIPCLFMDYSGWISADGSWTRFLQGLLTFRSAYMTSYPLDHCTILLIFNTLNKNNIYPFGLLTLPSKLLSYKRGKGWAIRSYLITSLPRVSAKSWEDC